MNLLLSNLASAHSPLNSILKLIGVILAVLRGKAAYILLCSFSILMKFRMLLGFGGHANQILI